ncbi:MAG: hypothetical protein WCP53_14625, partial [Verrucomicrobiota bacterium]
MMRQPVTAHRIVYGEVRVGGPVIYLHTRAPEGSDKLDILHLVVVLAGHEVDSIGDIFLSDQVVALDADGAAISEPFKRDDSVFAQFWKHLGASTQAADSVLIANSDGQWTGANRLAGRAYVHGNPRTSEPGGGRPAAGPLAREEAGAPHRPRRPAQGG